MRSRMTVEGEDRWPKIDGPRRKAAFAFDPLVGAETTITVAQGVPRFDVSRTCRAESAPRENKANTEACLTDEQKAREQLVSEWDKFRPTAGGLALD